MANKKITELTDIGTPDVDDVIEIVDVSDTTDSSEGTSKKVKVSELGGGGTQNIQQVLTEGSSAEFTGVYGETLSYEFNGEVINKSFKLTSFLENEDISSDSVNFIFGLDRTSIEYQRLTADQEELFQLELGITSEGSSEGNGGIGNEGEYTNILITQSSNQDFTEIAKYKLQFPTPVKSIDNPVVIVRFPQITTSGTYDIVTDNQIENFTTETYVNNGLNLKVDKVIGKSLIDDTEISRLASMTAIFTTALKTAYDSAVTWVTTNGTNVLNHLLSTSNPHNVTKSQVGLGNVDNTSDLNKPISTDTQTALNLKQDNAKLISANYTSLNNDNLIVNATCTITDVTSPSNGTNFTCTILSGTVTIGGVDYTQVGSKIARIYNSGAWKSYVYLDDKEWIDYSSTSIITGFSTFTNKVIKYKPKYKESLFYVNILGVSNSGFLNFTIPFNAITTSIFPCAVTNNSVAQSAMGMLYTTAGSDVIQVKINGAFGNFTTSNNKGFALTFTIETN